MMVMKRILIVLAMLLCGASTFAKFKPIEKRPQDVIDYTYNVRSSHSVSTTIFGLEYSYEGKVADRWTLLGRVGLVPTAFVVTSEPRLTAISGSMGVGLSFESRWYSNIAKRAAYGRSTYNNSSDFISMRLRANTGAPNGYEISFTPAYGIRRSFGRLWFHEITFGPKVGIDGTGWFVAPHIQYRLGLAF